MALEYVTKQEFENYKKIHKEEEWLNECKDSHSKYFSGSILNGVATIIGPLATYLSYEYNRSLGTIMGGLSLVAMLNFIWCFGNFRNYRDFVNNSKERLKELRRDS